MEQQTTRESTPRGYFDSFASFLESKKAIPLRIVILLLWLAAFAFGGMAQGKISSVAESDPSFFLPASAESTLASEEAAKFREDSTLPALVIMAFSDSRTFEREELGKIAGVVEQLPDAAIANGIKLSDISVGKIPFIPNKEMTAILVPVTFDKDAISELSPGNKKLLGTAVNTLRSHISGELDAVGFDDLAVYVSGPAGFAADLGSAFAGIDVTLLVVALALVFVILIVVYRSLLIPLAVLITSLAALCAAVLVVYQLALLGVLDLNGQTQGILAILVVGATTDYCLLFVARYREELATIEQPISALSAALKGSWEPIVASGGTVIAGLMILLLSDLSSTASLGPIASLGIIFSMLAGLTLLPGILMLPGKHARIMFWPAKIPHYGSETERYTGRFWGKVGKAVSGHSRVIWVGTLAVLLVFSVFAFAFRASGTSAVEQFVKPTQAVTGFKILEEEFSAGSSQPTTVLIGEHQATLAVAAIKEVKGVQSVQIVAKNGAAQTRDGDVKDVPLRDRLVKDGRVLINVATTMPAEDKKAADVVKKIRRALVPLNGNALVGGPAAQTLDTQQTAHRDFLIIFPVVLVVIALLLMLLLRSVVAPLLILAANVISFGATLGLCAILFNRGLEFPGADASVPLYAFVFLVALGIDYTIFLMSRAREESLNVGTTEGMTRAIGVTGGVITSAGIVLAATFAALAVVPLLFMIQLAIIVSLGIIIDTFIVRSLLIPGLVYDIGPRVWWPWTARQLPPPHTH